MVLGNARRRRRHTPRLVALTAAIAVVSSGCIGAISREEFDAMVQERGGGVSQTALDVVLDDIRQRTGSADPEIRFGFLDFGSATAAFEVRNPARPTELDTYAYRDEQFVGTSPVRLTAADDLDAGTVPVSAFAIDDLERLTELALAEFDSSDSYATNVTLLAMVDPPFIQVAVESPRSSGTAVFTADGRLREFRR